MANYEYEIPQGEVIINPHGERIALRFDVLPLFESHVGVDWQEQISEFIEGGELKLRAADGHFTNREDGTMARLGLVTAEGSEPASSVPGIWALYKSTFKEMMQKALPDDAEPLKAYDDPALALEGYAQQPVVEPGGDIVQHRMEAHVDMRYTAVLAIDMPTDTKDGGRLVISNRPDAKSVDEINQDATVVTHLPATLLCFSQGRKYPHYTEEVTNPASKRIVISLNYPVESEPHEAATALLAHIAGVEQ